MPMSRGKEKLCVTVDADLIDSIRKVTTNKSEYVNNLLRKHFQNADEQYDLKLQRDREEIDAKIAKRNAEKKQMQEQAEAKQKELDSKLAEAFKDIDTLNLASLTESQFIEKVREVAGKHGIEWSWDNNYSAMTALMNRASEKRGDNKIWGA